MTKRIFRAIAWTAVYTVIAVSLLLVLTLHTAYEGSISAEMRTEAAYIARALEQIPDDNAYLHSLAPTNRVTLIAPEGTVLFDSAVDPATLENHAQRPEVLAAVQNGTGESRRYSDTLAETTLYCAHRMADGSVVRIASTRSSGLGALIDVLPEISGMMLAVTAVSLLIAKVCAKQIVAPVNALDLENPLDNEVYDELAPLLTRMENQHGQIRQQMHDLERAHTETSAIMENMREGLVLLDSSNNVLTMNGSAAAIFDVPKAIGCDLLTICREQAVLVLVADAHAGQRGDGLLTRSGRTYRVYASPVMQQEAVRGVVLLILDVTERFAAENSRREFSANVSHELKTPLTTISGSAEIIRDGIARPEDIPTFAGKIHDEAQRLIALVNDILELSRLDEKQGLGAKETVSLLPLLRTLVEDYSPIAAEKGVFLHLEGSDAAVEGYPMLLREMFQNLIDNAVKYTPAGGRVDVLLLQEDGRVCCTVQDTGIGIPKEHHAHIFERFYRVDKSHSRQTGGTGLGLAIVKHVAEVHRAEIELKSDLDTGTQMTIRFVSAV